MTVFMERLQDLMNERGLNDKQLREQCEGISKNNLSNWRNGTKPQKAIVYKLAQFFGVSADYLLGIDGRKEQLTNMLDTSPDFNDPQLKALAKYFSKCDPDGQLRIIQLAMNEYDRSEAERKKEAERAVADLKSS